MPGSCSAGFWLQDLADRRWSMHYPKNRALKARILYVDPGSKAVRLSAKPHLVSLRGTGSLPPVGTLFQVSTCRPPAPW